jgi:hypothetical protein
MPFRDPSARRRRWGAQHRALRRKLKPVVARGFTACMRCGLTIKPGEAWDLDHADDGYGYLGPSHARCNRATAGRQRKVSRPW